MWATWSLLMLGLLAGTTHAQNGKYKGHKVAWILKASQDEENFIQHMEKLKMVEIWNEHIRQDPTDPLTVHLKPGALELLQQSGLNINVIVEDLEEEIEREKLESLVSKENGEGVFERYLQFSEILEYLEYLADMCGKRCSLFDIGHTHEGRPLRVIKVTGANKRKANQNIWIDAGIHSREWISPATNLFLLTKLIEDYDTDPDAQYMADMYDWYFMPVVNADGYVYTWNEDRLWRKSRQPNEGSECVGTDLNRNYDYEWMKVGSSNDPCSNKFAGQRPFSNPETAAVADFVSSKNGTWDLFITLHSKGQLFMSPWGYTKHPHPNKEKLDSAGLAAVDAIKQTHGKTYKYGSAASILYLSSGTSRDWASGTALIPYVYTIELRDTGLSGWILPPQNIHPTGEEIWAAVKAVVGNMM